MLGFCLAECEKLLTAGVLVGFPPETIRTRVERQAGGPGIPKELSTFGQLSGSLEFNPFTKLEIVPNDFPFPDPKECGVALSLKLAGIHTCAMCSAASPPIPSTASRNCCRGTSP